MKNCKFTKRLSASNKEIKADRAEMLAEEVSLQVTQFVGKIRQERLGLKNKVARLTDLAPDSKDSLRPTSDNFDAGQWVTELHSAKLELRLKDIELEEAEAIEKEWFTEEVEE